MKTKQRVLIIDEDEIRRAGIVHLLEQMGETFIVDEVKSFSRTVFGDRENLGDGKFLGTKRNHKYDLLILSDTSNNYMYTSDIKNIRKEFPESYIVSALSSGKNIYDILKLIGLGISGIITSDCSITEIQGIIQQVLLGMIVFPSRILDAGDGVFDTDLHLMGTRSFDVPFGQLTKRQTAVLGLLVQGKSNHEIAERLGIAENTVRVHLSAILKTLNASNRTQAAIIASTYLRGVGDPDAETS